MNILVANVSTFTKDTEITYTVNMPNCIKPTYKARHTNESIIICLANMQEVIKTGGIGRVIALVSSDAMNKRDDRFDNKTAFDYYSGIATSLGVKDIIKVPSEDGVEIILKNICDNVEINDKVYIDSAGGKRNISNIIQLLIKILKHKGIDNPFSLYSDINSQNNTGTIESTQNFDRIADLSEAFNEFMTTGKSDQLNDCLKDNSSIQYKNLVKAMAEFSDNIRLGAVEMLEDTINALRSAIDECSLQEPNDMESVIIHQFIPIIRDKFFVDQTQTDYCNLVHWCLDNGLIQQALTIFTEKIGIYIFNKHIIDFIGDIEQEKNNYRQETASNPTKLKCWETFAFCDDILPSATKSKNKDNKSIEEFKNAVLNGKPCYDLAVKKAVNCLSSFNNKSLSSNKNDKQSEIIRDFIKKSKTIYTYTGLKKSLCNQENDIYRLINIIPTIKDNPIIEENKLVKKFSAVDRIMNGENINNRYKLNVSNYSLAMMLYGYLYIKAVRNQTNHASSEENLSDGQTDVLSKYGYNFTPHNLDTIKHNVNIALKAIEDIKTSEQIPQPQVLRKITLRPEDQKRF